MHIGCLHQSSLLHIDCEIFDYEQANVTATSPLSNRSIEKRDWAEVHRPFPEGMPRRLGRPFPSRILFRNSLGRIAGNCYEIIYLLLRTIFKWLRFRNLLKTKSTTCSHRPSFRESCCTTASASARRCSLKISGFLSRRGSWKMNRILLKASAGQTAKVGNNSNGQWWNIHRVSCENPCNRRWTDNILCSFCECRKSAVLAQYIEEHL